MSTILQAPNQEIPEAWDTLVLGGREWPGIARVEVRRANKWDEKMARGSNQAEREYTGTEPADVSIVVRVWTVVQYDDLVAECLPLVEPPEEKKRKEPLEIAHAVCSARRISQVTIDRVDGPTDVGDGFFSFAIEATEYRPPTAVKPGPGSGKAPSGGSKCDQLAAQYDYWRAIWIAKDAESKSLRPIADLDRVTIAAGGTPTGAYDQWQRALSDALVAQAKMTELIAQMSGAGCLAPPGPGLARPNTGEAG